MRRQRRSAFFARLTSIFLLLSFVAPTSAVAEDGDHIPALQWPPIPNNYWAGNFVSGLSGSMTVACNGTEAGSDLVTYDADGHEIRRISPTETFDGEPNCIRAIAIGADDDLYGKSRSGRYVLAYAGNTLKWKYPIVCGSTAPVLGRNGNVYFLTVRDGYLRLVGLTPDVEDGQEQPAVVLDIYAGIGRCDLSKLYPYNDGIMVRISHYTAGMGHFYSYDGRDFGEATIGHWSEEKINAEGQLFVPAGGSGGGSMFGANVYDPLTRDVIRTDWLSTEGAQVQFGILHPLPNGGVAAVIKEEKMNYGFPAVPQQYIYSLGMSGKDAIPLPASGYLERGYTVPRMIALSNGDVVIARDVHRSYPGLSNSGVAIDVYSPDEERWTYHDLLINTSQAGGARGYNLDSTLPAVGPNTLFLPVFCYNPECESNQTTRLLFAVKIPGIESDYPRSSVLTPQTRVPYVALGDSFSSGEGVPPFKQGTAVPDWNTCHRSYFAYARVLDRSTTLSLPAGNFSACSGAETKHIDTDGFNNEVRQLESLSLSTKYVTITIGGNDANLIGFGAACVEWDCSFGSDVYRQARAKIENELPEKLERIYQAILQGAPNAEVLVLDYPQMAPLKSPDNENDIRCPYLYGGTDEDRISRPWAEARAARDVITRLNNAVENSVAGVRGLEPSQSRLHYVPVNGSSSPFQGHTICSDSGVSYFNNVDQAVGHREYALHPNGLGHLAYAQIVTAKLAEF